ncbi:hypothetical protein VM1G_08152 [Cytospora mali]|uniref:Uncharacterized protein n=1 Tax=Cytospora mali TaxID=578113 RepID=A0A194WA66_CYTMA|nr:hypothetical protein VM1G_08152 [Valsa mali]
MVLNKKQSGLSGRREVEIHIQLDQLPQQGNGNAVDARVDARVDDSAKVTTPLNTEPAQARKTNHMVGLSKKSPILQPKTGEEAVYGKTSGTWKAEEAFTKIQSEDGESQGLFGQDTDQLKDTHIRAKLARLLMFMGMTMLLGYKTPEAIALGRKYPGQVLECLEMAPQPMCSSTDEQKQPLVLV